MVRIHNDILRKQKRFWNNILFHPTDAVEDPWGRRILDRIAEDGAVETVRIYTMFEDIVYMDENGKLQYDFRLSDLRLDYLLEKGYNVILAYGGIPNCMASNLTSQTSVSMNQMVLRSLCLSFQVEVKIHAITRFVVRNIVRCMQHLSELCDVCLNVFALVEQVRL